ncbi:hypothetical protein [Thiolapillus sp.]
MAAKTCNGCMFKEGCIYNYLFETPPPPGAKRMKSYPSVPQPYVFTVPAEREKENCYVVEFVLVLVRGFNSSVQKPGNRNHA